MSQRELDRREKEHKLLQEQYDAVNEAWLTEINPATKTSLDYQLKALEAKLSELDDIIADLRRKIPPPPPPIPPPPSPRVQHTFELTLIKNGTGCKILARDPHGRSSQADIELPLLPHTSQSADINLSNAIEQGRLLYNTFFPHPISSHFIEALDTAKKQGDLLRLLIKTKPEDGFIDLAWEWLHNGNGFFILQYPCSVLRLAIQSNQSISGIAPKAPPCVLFTSAIPQGYDDFALPEEAIFQSVGHGMVHEKRITAPRFLHRLTNGADASETFNIWHHHGYASPSGLIFCDVQRRPTPFPITEIAKTLRMQETKTVWMAVIVLETSPHTPLASDFMALNVPLILIAPANMRPMVLQIFLETFYQQLGVLSPEDAIQKAQVRASQLCADDTQWAMPILISHVTPTWGKYDR